MTTRNWRHAVNGNFNTRWDWSGGVVPGSGDTAALDATGSDYTVTANTDETIGGLSIAANATLAVTGTRSDSTTFGVESVSSENDGVIKVGSINGTAGAFFRDDSSSPLVNNGVIIVDSGGTIQGEVDNQGVLEVVGGQVNGGVFATDKGRVRIDGGVMGAGDANEGSVTFFGTGGGQLQLWITGASRARFALINGFSTDGSTSVEVGGASVFGITFQNADYTRLAFGDGTKYIRFNGDFRDDTFSFQVNGEVTTITAHANPPGASASAATAPLVQAMAAFGAPASAAAAGTAGHATSAALALSVPHAGGHGLLA